MANEKELKDQRVPIMMTPSELEAIDDWMFENRIRSRGEAIRRLCQAGISTARLWRGLQIRIDETVRANHLAVRVFEEDFLIPAFENMSREESRRYANVVTSAYEALAELSGEKADFDGDVAPFLDVGITMDDARRKSDEEREALLRRLASRRAKPDE